MNTNRPRKVASTEPVPGADAPVLAPSAIAALDRAAILGMASDISASGRLGAGEPAVDQLVAVTDGLRRQRAFDELLSFTASEAVRQVSSPSIERMTAQALIERGRFADARAKLDPLLATPERMEALGLLGRIDKQIYMNEAQRRGRGDAARLQVAIDTYLSAYEGDRSRPVWHGINATALLMRARRDGVAHPRLDDATKLARALMRASSHAYDPDDADYFRLATAAEAALALGDNDAAELWLRRFVAHDGAPPSALASLSRQLTEVWGLRAEEGPGRLLLRPLTRALTRGFGQVLIPPDAVASGTDWVFPEARAMASMAMADPVARTVFEKVFTDSPFVSPEHLETGLRRCKAVGRVEQLTGEGFGTGFAIPGNALKKSWGPDLVFVTNGHVIPEGLKAEKSQVTFHALRARGKPHTSRFGETLATSSSEKLDYTVLRLKTQPTGLEAIPVADDLPAANSKAILYAIGHPKGGDLRFSMQDNRLIDHEAPKGFRVHYRTPTEPGSSGSPIFNDSWELVALHHAGSDKLDKLRGKGTYEANEGIWIRKIREKL